MLRYIEDHGTEMNMGYSIFLPIGFKFIPNSSGIYPGIICKKINFTFLLRSRNLAIHLFILIIQVIVAQVFIIQVLIIVFIIIF